MITKARVGSKFLFYGLVAGLLFAPQSGKETRAMAKEKFKKTVQGLKGQRT